MIKYKLVAFGLNDMEAQTEWYERPESAAAMSSHFAGEGYDWIYLVRLDEHSGEGEQRVAFDGLAFDLPDFEEYLESHTE